jgi:hypothetical protein
MDFFVFTRIPSRQGLINGIPEKVTLDECTAESRDDVMNRCHVPLGGEVYIIEKEVCMVVKSKIVKEVVDG